jgi:cyclophilin family peptidyl-prolyl cis-trans isomerase
VYTMYTMERASTTIRVRPSTVRKLAKLGRKGESHDRIIHRLIQKELLEVSDIDELSTTEIEESFEKPRVQACRINWDEVLKMDDNEFKKWLRKVASS